MPTYAQLYLHRRQHKIRVLIPMHTTQSISGQQIFNCRLAINNKKKCMYDKTLPIKISHNTGNSTEWSLPGDLTCAVLLHTYVMAMGDNTDWSVLSRDNRPNVPQIQFQCKDRSVTFVFPEITWTDMWHTEAPVYSLPERRAASAIRLTTHI
jgi:hypothetical protein